MTQPDDLTPADLLTTRQTDAIDQGWKSIVQKGKN